MRIPVDAGTMMPAPAVALFLGFVGVAAVTAPAMGKGRLVDADGCWQRSYMWGAERLCFERDGSVEACSLSREEGLCNFGRWRRRGSVLTLTMEDPAEGWPVNAAGDRLPSYRCRLHIMKTVMELRGCGLPGRWERVSR
jgi:hypothetical protein